MPQFFNCPCGKLHTTTHITMTSMCVCGRTIVDAYIERESIEASHRAARPAALENLARR